MQSRWTTWMLSLGIAAALFLGESRPAVGESLERAPGLVASARQTSHIEYDRVLDVTFTTAIDANGNAVITLNAGDLTLQKVVSSSGDATLRLTRGKDAVTIAINQDGYSVARGKHVASFRPAAPKDTDLDAVRSVLLGSRAVRAFRELTALLERQQGDDSVMVLAVLLDGAVVQMLDGDPGATERIAKRVTQKRRAALQPAQYRSAQFVDCVLQYELSLLYSWDLYWTCLQTAENNGWITYFFAKALCEWEFLIRSQQYIWQFTACMAIPR